MYRLWDARGYLTEGRRWFHDLLALPDTNVPADVRTWALIRASELAGHQGDAEAGRVLAEQAVHLQRTVGDRHTRAAALERLAMAAREEGKYEEARKLLEETLPIHRGQQGRWHLGRVLDRLATVMHALGDLGAARSLYEEALAIQREVGAQHLEVWSLHNLAALALDQGDTVAARTLGTEALAIRQQWGDKRGLLLSLTLFAGTAAAEGKCRRAMRLGSAIGALAEANDVGLGATYPERVERWLKPARRSLSRDAQAAADAEGRTLTLEQAIAYALRQDRNEVSSGFGWSGYAGTGSVAPHAQEAVPAGDLSRSGVIPSWASPAARTAGLTPREWAVLGLLVGGASNRAIADRLVISPHTAVRHVASVLRKLGAATRGEAVARVLGAVPPLQ